MVSCKSLLNCCVLSESPCLGGIFRVWSLHIRADIRILHVVLCLQCGRVESLL